ncbi:MAG: helix-turn-helix domain-containing protein [Phycisphaerales bacterium]
MTTTTQIHSDYLKLVRRFPLRPIRTARAHDQAMKLVGELAPAKEGSLSPGQSDYFDALTVLLEDYDRRFELVRVSGLDVLKSLMEARDMSVTDLGRVIGSQPNASLVLAGKREMSKAVMRTLGDYFGVDPSVFFA